MKYKATIKEPHLEIRIPHKQWDLSVTPLLNKIRLTHRRSILAPTKVMERDNDQAYTSEHHAKK